MNAFPSFTNPLDALTKLEGDVKNTAQFFQQPAVLIIGGLLVGAAVGAIFSHLNSHRDQLERLAKQGAVLLA